ncbi:hypothetical protein [Natrialba swarupiae]|uniref:Uncharacterized protein n=1 Tax=Natrialba swarupiae TaxID=2448032 RepID=A0A5D5AUJ9_9EURY|nr:hypothetical protein [Natrialba swarupiae]MCW8173114.1 hypothetical protein [Natrialba swarupiae]TYT63280.1 hypothetical protein FYC77_04205 [Natrialba swarupiae]
MSSQEPITEVSRYADRNTEFLSRVLAYGDTEARAYALALLSNGASAEDIDKIQAELDRIRRNLK